jgi:hypothetical protein
MSTGAAFIILANDGKTDRVLSATAFLRQRICYIMQQREKAGFEDTFPTIKDIEASHFIPFQSRFRPVVASNFEYQIIQSASGTFAFSSTCTFDLTPFGEFISDAVLNINASASSCATAAVAAAGTNVGPTDAQAGSYTAETITLPCGNTLSTLENVTRGGDTVTVIRRLRFVARVDETGQTIADGTTYPDRVFYCDFPGERMVKSCEARFCSNMLDKYTTDLAIFYRKTMLPIHKMDAYCRLVGMEVASTAMSQPVGVSGGGSTVRVVDRVVSGPQTPKVVQPAMSWWVPLLFTWCQDYSKPIMCSHIPVGQRLFIFELAAQDDIVFRGPAYWNKFVLVEDIYTTELTITSSAATLVAATHYVTSGTMSNQWVLLYPVYTNGALTAPTFNNISLYVNNIFTLGEIIEIYVERIGFNLIRIHVYHTAGINTTAQSMQVSQFKYPVEYFWFGLMRNSNRAAPSSTANEVRHDFWHRFTSPSRKLLWGGNQKSQLFITPQGATASFTAPANFSDGGSTPVTYRVRLAEGNTARVVEEVSNISTLCVKVYAVELYRTTSSTFYNQYIPYQFGEEKIKSCDDSGIMFVNFTLTPGSRQPCNYVNTSRAREFYVDWTSTIIGTSDSSGATISATVLAYGRAINFIVQTEGSVNIRYIT